MLSLHDQANESFVGRLHDALSQLRGGTGCVGQAIKIDAGGPSVRVDPAQGRTEPGSDIGGNQGVVK